jgi:hypothetical protein
LNTWSQKQIKGMTSVILTPPTENELLLFMPLVRLRDACFVSNSSQDAQLKDYARAAYDDGLSEARSSFLPQTIKAIFRTPYATTKAFGLEGKITDLDGVQGAFRLPHGPIISITHIKLHDESGQVAETISADNYTLESNRFIRWSKDFTWNTVAVRPSFEVVYQAGLLPSDPLLTKVKIACLELLAAKWDAKGGNYTMPTTARRVFHSMRTSRTYVPSGN